MELRKAIRPPSPRRQNVPQTASRSAPLVRNAVAAGEALGRRWGGVCQRAEKLAVVVAMGAALTSGFACTAHAESVEGSPSERQWIKIRWCRADAVLNSRKESLPRAASRPPCSVLLVLHLRARLPAKASIVRSLLLPFYLIPVIFRRAS